MVCKPAEQGKGGGEENMYVGERRAGERGLEREESGNSFGGVPECFIWMH